MFRATARMASAAALGFVFLFASAGLSEAKELVVTPQECTKGGGSVVRPNPVLSLCVGGTHDGSYVLPPW